MATSTADEDRRRWRLRAHDRGAAIHAVRFREQARRRRGAIESRGEHGGFRRQTALDDRDEGPVVQPAIRRAPAGDHEAALRCICATRTTSTATSRASSATGTARRTSRTGRSPAARRRPTLLADRAPALARSDDPRREDGLSLRHALGELSDEQRPVVVLRDIVGVSRAEMAGRLGRGESSVNGLHRLPALSPPPGLSPRGSYERRCARSSVYGIDGPGDHA